MRKRKSRSTIVPSATGTGKRHKVGGARRRKTAEQPEGHGRKLVVGIGEIFHEPDAGAEQRADHHAGQHQHKDRIARADRGADQIDRGDRNQPADKREALDRDHAEREINAEHRAERRARRRAENVGRDQRIAEQALERGAGNRERRAHEKRRDHTRPAHLQDHAFDGRGHAGRLPGDLAPHHGDDIGELDRKAADQKRHGETRREHGERDQEAGNGRAGHPQPPPLQHARDLRVARRHMIEAPVEIARQRREVFRKTLADKESSQATTIRSAG